MESPLHYSNVSLIDPVTKSPVRITWRYLEDGSKVRVTRGTLASGSVIPRPEVLKQRRKPRPVDAGPSDTTAAAAAVVTHVPGDLPSALKPLLKQRQAHTAAALGAAGSSLPLEVAPTRFAVFSRRRGAAFGPWRGFAASAVTDYR